MNNLLILRSVKQLRSYLAAIDGSLGFVPTMGALHEGHATLVRSSRVQNKFTVVSIFVNPTQFNDPSDFDNYPLALGEDLALLQKLNVDAVFLPSVVEMYPQGVNFKIEELKKSSLMCGVFRPGHFSGMLTVVMKLLNIVAPTRAYFGEKDYQQLELVRDMVVEFFLNTEIVAVPTQRELSGLARSSRNRRLSESGRQKASRIFSVLQSAPNPQAALQTLKLEQFEVEYVEEHWGRRFVAAKIENVRLIDNIGVSRDDSKS